MDAGRRYLSLIPSVLVALVLVAATWWALKATPADGLRITQAQAADEVGEGATRFPTGADMRSAELPDDWSVSRPWGESPVWYRMRFEVPASLQGQRLAIYVERACSNAMIWLNGELLHQVGRMEEPISRLCRQPIHLPLTATQLRKGENVLDLRLAGHPIQKVGSDDRTGGLSIVEVGNVDATATKAARGTTARVDLPRTTSFAFWLLGTLMLLLGRVHRRESHLLYFGLLLLALGAHLTRQWWFDIPLGHYATEMLHASLWPMMALATVIFFLRYAGWRSQPIEVALYAQCLIMPASLLLGGPSRIHTLASSWIVLLTTEMMIAMGLYLWTMWHRDRRQFALMTLICGAGTVCIIGLVMLQQDRDAAVPEAWMQHGLTLAFIAVSFRLMHQFARELQVSEASRISTEARVRDATHEIERNFAQLAELRVEQVTAQERKRIAGDLHDDLGAKLLTIVHTSDNDRISTLAREALEEMRLSVRGLTGKPVKLADAIGDWRAEFVSRLSQTGLEADWESPSDDEMPQTLSARTYVQTTRILREAVNNIIKHSGASRCGVTVTIAEGDVQLNIQDNGKGIQEVFDGRLDRGHGMASMKQRAKQLHGQCLVESSPGYGTVIRLTLPLDRQVETA